MTALCSGGASGPKPGVADLIVYSSGALASLLNNKGGWWALLAAPLLGVLSYRATDLCGTDPPTPVALTSAEYDALLALAPWDTLQTAIGKLVDLATNAIWYDLCQCTSVGTPAQPTSLFAPPTSVNVQTPAIGPCIHRTYRVTASIISGVGVSLPAASQYGPKMFPELATAAIAASAGFMDAHNAAVMPVPIYTFVRANVSLVTQANNAGHTSTVGWLDRPNTSGAFISGFEVNVSPTTPFAYQSPQWWPVDPTAVSFDVYAYQIGGTVPAVMDVELDYFCAGSGPTAAASCCTDPAVIALLQYLVKTTTQQQRWRLPFATVAGSSHVVTGSGSFAVSRNVGLSIDVTATPANVRTSFGNPSYQWDLGWLSVTDGGALLQELRITRTSQTWFPQQMQLATSVGYALPPGVQLTITEQLVES